MKLKRIKKTGKREGMVCVSSPDKEDVVCSVDGRATKIEAREETSGEVGRGNVFIGTLNFFATPYRALQKSYESKYGSVKKLFYLDLILLIVLGILIGLNIYLFLSQFETPFIQLRSGRSIVTSASGGTGQPALPSDFLTTIKINNQSDAIVSPGEFLDYVISYKNSGERDLYDVILKINLAGSILDYDEVETWGGVLGEGVIIWTKEQVSDFSRLPAGSEGELKFKIGTVREIEQAKIISFGSMLRSWIDISYKEDDFGEPIHLSGAVMENKVNSDLLLRSLARYYTKEGDQLGRGPLPPVIGEVTKYWVFWSVENNLNDVSGVSVSAVLPSNVEWTGNESVSLGDLTYNQSRRTVTWTVGDVSRYMGEEWPKQGVAFALSLIPRLEQLGEEAVLLENIKVFGNDKFTGRFLEIKMEDLTTNLMYDDLAQNKGLVTE